VTELRLGTRGSALALWQARAAAAAIEAATGRETRIEVISTRGDQDRSRPFREVGERGIFAHELEQALLAGEIDVAVHSAKDVALEPPAALSLAACLPRGTAEDAWCGPADALAAVPSGARVGTGSVRRAAQLSTLRPDLEIVPIRGNVDTRLARRAERGLDAVVLAAAGVQRLGLDEHIGFLLDASVMVPEPGQGIVVLQVRRGDDALVAGAGDADALLALEAERLVARALGGGCTVPVAAHARREGTGWSVFGFAQAPDGSDRGTRRVDSEDLTGAAQAVADLLAEVGLGAPGRGVRA
jgi:hydroxymethylbilane synthase